LDLERKNFEQYMRKRCGRCRNYKDSTRYHRHSKNDSGLQLWCISCMKKYQQNWEY